MNDRPPIPPPGPELALRPWAQLATEYLRRYVPDVRASVLAGAVTWRLQGRSAVLAPLGGAWFIALENEGRSTGAGLSLTRHDAFTAENVGGTLVGFFDAGLSRPGHRLA